MFFLIVLYNQLILRRLTEIQLAHLSVSEANTEHLNSEHAQFTEFCSYCILKTLPYSSFTSGTLNLTVSGVFLVQTARVPFHT